MLRTVNKKEEKTMNVVKIDMNRIFRLSDALERFINEKTNDSLKTAITKIGTVN